MRAFFSNTILLCIIVFVILIINITISVKTNDLSLFQRSGSIIVLLGILIAARRIIRLGKEHRNEDYNLPDDSIEGKKVLLDERAELIVGPFVAFIGTIIWGYGDLILNWFI